MAKREKTGTEGIHKALTHPMRGEILLRMQESGPLSPMMYSTATARSLNLVAYHFKTLAQHGAIELVDTKPRRGATEHFYAINPDSPVVRLLFASRVSEARSQDPSEEFLRRVIETDSDDKTGVSITPSSWTTPGGRKSRTSSPTRASACARPRPPHTTARSPPTRNPPRCTSPWPHFAGTGRATEAQLSHCCRESNHSQSPEDEPNRVAGLRVRLAESGSLTEPRYVSRRLHGLRHRRPLPAGPLGDDRDHGLGAGRPRRTADHRDRAAGRHRGLRRRQRLLLARSQDRRPGLPSACSRAKREKDGCGGPNRRCAVEASILIAIGRFIPGGRTATTFAAGTLEMPYRNFLVADGVAALRLGPLHLDARLPGR